MSGGARGLQNRCEATSLSQVGSTPTHSRHFDFYSDSELEPTSRSQQPTWPSLPQQADSVLTRFA